MSKFGPISYSFQKSAVFGVLVGMKVLPWNERYQEHQLEVLTEVVELQIHEIAET